MYIETSKKVHIMTINELQEKIDAQLDRIIRVQKLSESEKFQKFTEQEQNVIASFMVKMQKYYCFLLQRMQILKEKERFE